MIKFMKLFTLKSNLIRQILEFEGQMVYSQGPVPVTGDDEVVA